MGGVFSRAKEDLRNEVNDSENVSPIFPFPELPNEVWSRIFGNLRARDLRTVRQVCKNWCHIVDGTKAQFRIAIDGKTDLGAIETFYSKGLHADLLTIWDFSFTYPRKGFGFKAVKLLSLDLDGEIKKEGKWRLGRNVKSLNITRVLEEMRDLPKLYVGMPQKMVGDVSSFTFMILPNLTSLHIFESNHNRGASSSQTIVSDSISIFSNTFPKLENLTVDFGWALRSSIPNPDETPAQCLIALINFILCHRNTLKTLNLSLTIRGRWELDNILFARKPLPLVEYQKINEELEGLHLHTLYSGSWDTCHIRVEDIGPVDLVFEIYQSQHSLKELHHLYTFCCDGSFQNMLNIFTGIIQSNNKTLTKIELCFEEPRGMAYIEDLPDDRNEFTCAVFQECEKLACLSIIYLGRNRSLFKIMDLHLLPNSIRTLNLEICCEEILDFACQGTLPSLNHLSVCIDEYETLQNLRSGGMLLQIVRANSGLKELKVYSTRFRKSDDGTPQTEVLLWSDLLWRNGLNQARVEDDGRYAEINAYVIPGSEARCIRIRF